MPKGALIIGLSRPQGESTNGESPDEEMGEGVSAVASEIAGALPAGTDQTKLKDALMNFARMIKSSS